jgi:hypothetical protein
MRTIDFGSTNDIKNPRVDLLRNNFGKFALDVIG